MFSLVVFWVFQVINGVSSMALVLNPKKAHESTFKDPARVYQALGFSETAQEMLHNALRGQGAALLAITGTLFFMGPHNPYSFLLMALTCLLTLVTHLLTYCHHIRNQLVRETLGDYLKSIYVLIGINLVVGGAALGVFISF